MFPFFKKLFGPRTDFKALKEAGAIILDVRSPQEFDRGNIKGSKNIPVNNIQREISTIKKWNKPVITVCQSGGRSSMAKSVLKAAGIEVNVGNFPIKALGRARASMDTSGFIKVISDKTTDEVLGVHMISARAADLIMEAAMAMEYRASAEDIARICHPHPTYSEALKEAALGATGNRALHV